MAVIIDRNLTGCRTGEIEGARFTGSEKLDHGYQGASDGILKPHDVSGDLKMDVAHLDWQALHLMDTRFRPPSTWVSVSAVTSEKGMS